MSWTTFISNQFSAGLEKGKDLIGKIPTPSPKVFNFFGDTAIEISKFLGIALQKFAELTTIFGAQLERLSTSASTGLKGRVIPFFESNTGKYAATAAAATLTFGAIYLGYKLKKNKQAKAEAARKAAEEKAAEEARRLNPQILAEGFDLINANSEKTIKDLRDLIIQKNGELAKNIEVYEILKKNYEDLVTRGTKHATTLNQTEENLRKVTQERDLLATTNQKLAPLQKEVEELKKQNKTLENSATSLQASVKQNKIDIQNQLKELAELQGKLDIAIGNEKLAKASSQEEITKKENAYQALQGELKNAQTSIETLRKETEEKIAQYQNTNKLLNGEIGKLKEQNEFLTKKMAGFKDTLIAPVSSIPDPIVPSINTTPTPIDLTTLPFGAQVAQPLLPASPANANGGTPTTN